MGGQRGSDRAITVIGSCGHEKVALVHGFHPGKASARNIYNTEHSPCYDCRLKEAETKRISECA